MIAHIQCVLLWQVNQQKQVEPVERHLGDGTDLGVPLATNTGSEAVPAVEKQASQVHLVSRPV